MGKIGFIFDSTCGLSKDEVESMGYGYFSMLIEIDNEIYKTGDTIDSKQVLEKMTDRNVIIKTSLPTGADIEKAFDYVLENYDQAVYIGISHKFSGTHNAVKLLSQEDKYKGKIFVPQTHFSSPWTTLYVKEIINIKDKLLTIKDIEKYIEFTNDKMTGYLSPGDIWWFYKGGRISKMQYVVGNLAKIFPILKVTNGDFDKSMTIKIRNRSRSIEKMIELIKTQISELKTKGIKFEYLILDTNDETKNNEMVDLIRKTLQINDKISKVLLTPEQIAHLGPDSFGFTLFVPAKGNIL